MYCFFFKINFHIQNISVITKTNHLLNISPHPENARTLPFAHLPIGPCAHGITITKPTSATRGVVVVHSPSFIILDHHLSLQTIIHHEPLFIFCHQSPLFVMICVIIHHHFCSSSWSMVCSLSLSMLLCTFVSSLIFLIHDFLFVIIIYYWYYDYCYSFYAFSFLSVSW